MAPKTTETRCIPCGISFSSLSEMERHLQSLKHKNATTTFECPTCKKVCGNKGALTQHINKMHSKKSSRKGSSGKQGYNTRSKRAKNPVECYRYVKNAHDRTFVEGRKKIEEQNLVEKRNRLEQLNNESGGGDRNALVLLQNEIETLEKMVRYFTEFLMD